MKGPSTYIFKKTSFVKKKVDCQRAQLISINHELRGQKLAEILIFYAGQKISRPILEPIGLKLLTLPYWLGLKVRWGQLYY